MPGEPREALREAACTPKTSASGFAAEAVGIALRALAEEPVDAYGLAHRKNRRESRERRSAEPHAPPERHEPPAKELGRQKLPV